MWSAFSDVATRAPSDAATALSAYNDTFATLFMARVGNPDEIYGFGMNFYYPNAANGSKFQSLAVTRERHDTRASSMPIYTWTMNDINYAYNYTVNEDDVPSLVNPSVPYETFDFIPDFLSQLDSARRVPNTTANFDAVTGNFQQKIGGWQSPPTPRRALDGTVYWTFAYSILRLATSDGNLIALPQAYIDTSTWDNFLTHAVRDQPENPIMYLVTSQMRLIATSDPMLNTWRVNCPNIRPVRWAQRCFSETTIYLSVQVASVQTNAPGVGSVTTAAGTAEQLDALTEATTIITGLAALV
jgi:hypothetical protein